jgi:uncharacterized protein (DUF1697 family)
VGLVRNVMLGREGLHRSVLVDLVTTAGGSDVASYLTTGNVTFSADVGAVTGIVGRLQDSLAAVIGREEIVAVRSRAWLRELVARAPFAAYDAASWYQEVAFLPASATPLPDLPIGVTGSTVVVEVGARELLTARPVSGPRGPHANPLIERLSGARATSRGWSTVIRLARDQRSGSA